MTRARGALLAIALLPAALSCTLPEWPWASEPPPPAPAPPPAREFSAERAWSHMEQLVALGPRVAGTEGAQRTRDYIRGQLEELGLEVVEYPFEVGSDPEAPVQVVHLVGVIPGESADLMLLGALFDTADLPDIEFVGANGSGSGVALLLELARAIRDRPLPYTTWVVFLDGEGLDPPWAPGQGWGGSRAFARELARTGVLARVRLAVFFDQVADADLHFTRDLRSQRGYREAFWSAGSRLGKRDVFDPEAPTERLATSHVAFFEIGMRRVVAIADNRYGDGDPPGAYWNTADDTLEHCSADSLETVGSVSLAALDEITRRMRKVDRFAPPQEPPAAESPESSPEEGDGGSP